MLGTMSQSGRKSLWLSKSFWLSFAILLMSLCAPVQAWAFDWSLCALPNPVQLTAKANPSVVSIIESGNTSTDDNFCDENRQGLFASSSDAASNANSYAAVTVTGSNGGSFTFTPECGGVACPGPLTGANFFYDVTINSVAPSNLRTDTVTVWIRDSGGGAEAVAITLNYPATTATSVTASPNFATQGQTETLTATVSNAMNTVSEGTVSFSSDSAAISGCTAVAVSNNVATCNTDLPQGGHSIGAAYSGTANYFASSADAVTETVLAPVTATQSVASKALTQTIAATSFTPVTGGGGKLPLAYGLSAALPSGLSFDASSGQISGTPGTTLTPTIFTVTVTDANNQTASNTFQLTVNAPVATTPALASKSLTQGRAASFTPVTASGGSPSITFTISPSLPGGLSIASGTGLVSGTPTGTLASTNFAVTATDANGSFASSSFSLTINATVSAPSPGAAQVLTEGHAVTTFTPVAFSGGTPSLVYGISPALPNGLTLSPSLGSISGASSVTLAATSFTVTATDANGGSASNTFSLTVNSAVTATQTIPSETLTASHAASFTPVIGGGGTGSLSYSIAPSLPTGLSIASDTGVIAGAAAGASTATTYTVIATDTNGATASNTFSLTVNGPVVASQAIATESFTQNHPITSVQPVTASGGTPVLSYSISPSLPAGLSFAAGSGLISGTPTATLGATVFTVTATDINGATDSATFTLTVNAPPTATQSIPAETLTQQHMASFIPVTGGSGAAPLSYSVAPSLPAGLSIDAGSGTISGIPTGTLAAANFTVTVTDGNGVTASNSFSLTIKTAVTASQTVAVETLTQGRQATFAPVTGGGGTGTLGYSVAPSLPAGLTIDGTSGSISGTASAALAATSFSVIVTDANGATASNSFSLTINAPPMAVQNVPTTSLTQNFTGAPFTPVTVNNGTAPYAYAVSPTLPAGLTIDGASGTISGKPIVALAATGFTVTVTDINGATASNSFSLTVNGPVVATTAIASKGLTVEHAVDTSFSPVTGSGGTGTLHYTAAPTLPTGIAMDPNTGGITGLPTAESGATAYTATVTDANGATATAPFSLTVNGPVTAATAVATTTLTQNHGGAAFTPVTGGGGTTPYSYSVAPALPAGLSFSASTGAVGGTASVTAATTSYTVTVTDLNGASNTAAFSLTVDPQVTATAAVPTTSLKVNQPATPFAPVTAAGGTGALVYSIVPSLPSGLSLAAATGAISGTPTVTIPATSYSVTATDTNGATAQAGFALTVTTTQSSLALTSSANPSSFGQTVTFTAALSGTGGVPTGTVVFKDGATTLFTGTLANGLSSYSSTTLAPGSHTISASYSGDAIFAGSSFSVAQLVGGASTTGGQTYSYTGTLPSFSSPGKGVVDTVNGHILIADTGNQRVEVLSTATLATVAIIGTTGVAGSDNAHFDNPTGAAFVGTTDQIFVSDSGNDRIQVFDAVSFAYVGTISGTSGSARLLATGEASFSAPGGMYADAGRLYVADTGNQRVQIFDAATMAYVATLGSTGVAGADNAHFNAPADVTVNDAVGEILVADRGNSRVQRFDVTTLAYKGTIGGKGLAVGDSDYLSQPTAIAYDAASNLVLIADGAEQRVEVFDALGYTYVLTLGSTGQAGSGNGQFSDPAGVTIDAAHQRVLVADQANNRVQIFAITPNVAFASVLPGSRSVELGSPATIFATMINAGTTPLQGCQVVLPATAPQGLRLTYQTTDPATNALTGVQDMPATIAGNNGVASFLVTLQGTAAFSAPDMALDFACLGIGPAAVETGVDTVDLAMSSVPVADIIALAATASNDGIATVPVGGATAFAVASSNVGATSQITVSVDTGAASLPLTATLCQSNPSTGACLATPSTAVTLSDAAGAAPTFSVFLQANGAIPFAPATSRVFLRFKDPAGGLHGATSVAVRAK